MAKYNIQFNDKEYHVDDAPFASSVTYLQSHLQNVMNGNGSVIEFGGVDYNIDSTKLANATNIFVSYLGTISGTGYKVNVNGVEYSVDPTKLSGAISDIEAVLGGSGEGDLSDLNEYGFYYNSKYSVYNHDTSTGFPEGELSFCFKEDQNADVYSNDVLIQTLPATYSDDSITIPALGYTVNVLDEGKTLYSPLTGIALKLGDAIVMSGDYTYKFIPYEGDYGWWVFVNRTDKSTYSTIKNEIEGYPVISLNATFDSCINLTTAPVIPDTVKYMNGTFQYRENLTGNVEINCNPISYVDCFKWTTKPITITGSCSAETKAALAATANNKNVSY